LARRQEKI